MKTKTEDLYKDFSTDKKMFDFINYSTNIKMFYWIRNVWDIRWIGFKVEIIE